MQIELTPRQRGDLADILEQVAYDSRESAKEATGEFADERQGLLENAQQADELRAVILGEPAPEPKHPELIQNLYYEPGG